MRRERDRLIAQLADHPSGETPGRSGVERGRKGEGGRSGGERGREGEGGRTDKELRRTRAELKMKCAEVSCTQNLRIMVKNVRMMIQYINYVCVFVINWTKTC